jgi:uncharacterized membrane protein YeiH
MTTVFFIIEIIGIISFSISGAIEAINKETDLFGVVFLSVVTSFGGGMIRDVLIGNTVPVFFRSHVLILMCVLASLAVFIVAAVFKNKFVKNEELIAKINNIFDAVALGAFSVSGAKITMDFGISEPLVVILMGMITCVGGSLIRDFCLREIPFILRKRVYAFAALSGSACYWLMLYLGAGEILSMIISPVLVFSIRMLATVFKWNFPKAIDFSKLKNE